MSNFHEVPNKNIPSSYTLLTTKFPLFVPIILSVFSINAQAQVSVSPDFKVPEIVVPELETTKAKSSPQTGLLQATKEGLVEATQEKRSVDDPDAQVVISPTSIVTPTEKIGSSVSVITKKDLENNQWRTGPDALKYVPGVNVVQSGGTGAFTSIFMRGTNSNHTKVLIDGIDVSDPSSISRLYDFGQLSTWDIERIEVLRGPQSGLYGADAFGGVISITTKKGEGPPLVVSSFEGGAFGTFNQSASFSGAEKKFNYAGSIGHLRSTDIPVTPSNLLPPGQNRNNDSYDNWTYSTKLGLDVTKNLTLNTVARYTDSTSLFTEDGFTSLGYFPNAQRSQRDFQQFVSRGEAVINLFGGDLQNFLAIAYSNNQNSTESPDPFNSTASEGDRVKVDWRSVVRLAESQRLVLGLEDQNETLNTTSLDLLFQKVPIDASERDKAAYLELQSELFDRLFLVANVRYDDNSNFGDATTWRFSSAYLVPIVDTKIKGSVGTGFKAPSLTDRFVDFLGYAYVANRNLQPETNLGYDVGFEQPLLKNDVRFGATYFHNDLTNLIQYAPCYFTSFIINPIDGCVNSSDNVASATTSGVESFVELKVLDNITIRGDYTYTKAVNNDTGDQLLRRPQNKGSVTALWGPTTRLTLSATLLSVGSWRDVGRLTFEPVTSPGYTVVNLASDYKINDGVSLYGRIDNLFNDIYEEPSGFQHPGFGAFMGLRFRGP